MNTPNKLTILRVILVPFFIAFLLIDSIPFNNAFALIIFSLASITDAVDGYLARKNNQITTFGKFLDPLADKILVVSAMICFIELGYTSAVPIVIIIAREFMVTSIRLLAVAGDGKVIAAGMLGKIKTVISMVSIVAILLLSALSEILVWKFDIAAIGNILMWISAAITVVSGLEYLIANRKVILQSK